MSKIEGITLLQQANFCEFGNMNKGIVMVR